ncbi:MAG TPA: response regulator [Terriglobales bacterium]|nr:response regulator [Terriglobales bacterium]
MKRILFVDDESKILDGIRRMLYGDRQRWEMHFAMGPEAALKACQSGAFDVVISDMRMPELDGATLLAKIRDLYPSTARIILSGYSEPDLSTRAISVAHRFLAKPCNAVDLRNTIERTCTLQDLLRSPELRNIVGEVAKLPSLSSTYTALVRAIDEPDSSIGNIGRIIEKDIAMSAKVLQLANSAFFGLAKEVTSISHAVSYLGMQTLKNLVLTTEVFSVFAPDGKASFDCDLLQEHGHRTAAIVSKLPLHAKEREIAVIASLLHDAGKLFLAAKMPQKFTASLELARQRGCEFFEAEEELLGSSHAEIGAYLLGLWGIPHLAVEAIAHHHHPTRIAHSGFDIATAVYVADVLANEPSVLEDSWPKEPDRTFLQTLGIWAQFDEFRELARVALTAP